MNNADPGETNRSLTAINLTDGKEEESCRWYLPYTITRLFLRCFISSPILYKHRNNFLWTFLVSFWASFKTWTVEHGNSLFSVIRRIEIQFSKWISVLQISNSMFKELFLFTYMLNRFLAGALLSVDYCLSPWPYKCYNTEKCHSTPNCSLS